MTSDDFFIARAHADVILSICVLDAIPDDERLFVAHSAFRNLRRGGYYVVVVPRNNNSVLRRCTPDHAAFDGYSWCRGRSCTFYRNFRDHGPLLGMLLAVGFELVQDRSRYEYVWLILRKP